MVQTPARKIAVPAGVDPEQHVRKVVVEYNQDKIEKVLKITITPLKIKPLQKSVKILTNHDYVMMTATFQDGVVRLTAARYSEKLSGSGVKEFGKEILNAFSKFINDSKSTLKISERVEAVAELARKASNVQGFAEAIKAL